MSTPKKPSGFIGFGKPQSAVPVEQTPKSETPPKDERRVKSVRLTREQWKKVRDMETQREQTFQELCIKGLNLVRAEDGLEPL
jgi:hypothetical protein